MINRTIQFITVFLLISLQYVFAQTTNLVTYGLPDSIPTRLAPAINKYRSNTDFPSFITWDEKGKSILLNGGQIVYQMKRNGGIKEKYKLKQNLGEYLSPDQKKFMYLEDEDGDENFQLFLYDIPSGAELAITEKGTRSTTPFWKPDGTQILYKSNRRKSDETDLYIRNVALPYHDKLLLKNITDEAVIQDWDLATNRILFTEIISELDKKLFLYDLNTGLLEQINKDKTTIAHAKALFLTDKDNCLIVSDEDSEFLQLRSYNFKNHTSSKITAFNWDITEISLSRNGRYLAFVVNQNGTSQLYRMNVNDFSFQEASTIPEGIISDIKIDHQGNKTAFNFYGSTFRRKVYGYDFLNQELYQFINKHATPKPEFNFVKAEKVSVQVHEKTKSPGYTIPALIYKPKANKIHPVYIDIHGGPEYQALPSFNRWYQYLVNELEIAVVIPNIRGSNGYGKSYMKADNTTERKNAIDDVGELLNWIAQQPDLDKDKIMISGESYGGFIVLSALVNYPGKIRCGVDVVGISNLVTYLEKTRDYRKDLRRVEFGDERNPIIRTYLQSISPANHSDKITSPLMIIQGYNDSRVNPQESEKMVSLLQQQKKPVWYIGAKDEGHGFHKPANIAIQRNAEIMFLKKYLLEN